jgi:2-isopropylmalate synthase
MAVKTRRDYFGLDVNIDAKHIVAASRMVSQTTGFVVQPNKAVVGANAFAHASGIHQDGVLKARDTYEIMRAEDVGWSANKIVLGKLSGPQRLQAAADGAGRAAGERGRRQHGLSPASRSWPTARARSSTRTSWRWSATRA